MKLLLTFLINILVVALFLYSKLLPYKNNLNNEYRGVFGFFNKVFTPIIDFLKRFIKPFPVGKGLAVDMTQIVLLILLLVILNILK